MPRQQIHGMSNSGPIRSETQALLQKISAKIRKYIVLRPEAVIATALWTMMAWAQNGKSCDTHSDINDSTLVERFVRPTLSELIEACPKQMGTATFVLGSANQGQAWVACYFDFRANRGAELNETGQTPDEAVARLWLALHRNGRQQL